MTRKPVTNSDESSNAEGLQQSLAQSIDEQRKSQATVDSFVNGDYVPLQEQIKRDIQKIDDWYKALPSKVEKAIEIMAAKGWYWDQEMNLQDILGTEDTESTSLDIGQELEEYFEDELDRIEQDIISRLKNTNRTGIILSIFSAHRSGFYNLTIPTIFTQVDSECVEKLGQTFFQSTDKKPNTAKNSNIKNSSGIRRSIFYILLEKSPINLIGNERKEIADFKELNRHQVIHGDKLDYGTKRNSLKAISLLNYVSIALAGELKYP